MKKKKNPSSEEKKKISVPEANKISPTADALTNEHSLSVGSSNAFASTENPQDEVDKELSDEQLDDLIDE